MRESNQKAERDSTKKSDNSVTIVPLNKDNDVTPSSPDLAASVDMVRTT